MEEGEIYAIETFGSTGNGYVREDGECSHYMMEQEPSGVMLKHPKARPLLNLIKENFSTLAWCRRWVDDLGFENHLLPLNELVRKEIITEYPPLVDISKSFVA
jgi:methionyl aminopeptidase